MTTIPAITVQLVHIQGPLKGEIQELTDTEIRIGRHPDCQVRFSKELVTISRHHALISRDGNRFKIIDQSTNGTFVNGQAISEAILKDGDVIMLAEAGPKISFLTRVEEDQPYSASSPPMATPAPSPPSVLAASFKPQNADNPKQSMPRPAEPSGFSLPPLQPQRPQPPPVKAVETVKVPLAIQFGAALKSFQTLPIVLGKGPGCDFTINHPTVNERHAQIYFYQDRYWIKDLTGANMVLLNGQPIQTQAGLEPNMQIALSPQGPKFRFLAGGRLAEIEDPQPEPQAPGQPAPSEPQPGPTGRKPGSIFKKFFS